MKLEINLNETVEVVLSEYAARVYNEYYWDLDIPEKYAPPTKQAGDVLHDQLWHVIKVFGPAVCIGGQSLFEGHVIVFNKGIS